MLTAANNELLARTGPGTPICTAKVVCAVAGALMAEAAAASAAMMIHLFPMLTSSVQGSHDESFR